MMASSLKKIIAILGFVIGVIIGIFNKPSFVWLYINTNILYIDKLDFLLPISYIISGLFFSLLFNYLLQYFIKRKTIENKAVFLVQNNVYCIIAHIVLCISGMLYVGYTIGIFGSLLLYVLLGFFFRNHQRGLLNLLSVISIPILFLSLWFLFQLADINKIEYLNVSMNTLFLFLTSPFAGLKDLGLQDDKFFIIFFIPSALLWTGMQLRKRITNSDIEN